MRVSARPGFLVGVAGAGMAAVLLGTAACGGESAPAAVIESTPATPYRATMLPTSYTLPDVTMTDTDGRPYDLPKRTRGKVTMLFFGFANCPDVCPTTMADAAAALRLLGPAEQARIQVVFITADPARDTPAALKDYLGRFHPSFVGLTGPWKTIERAAGVAMVPVGPAPKNARGNYQVQHGSNIMTYGPDGSGRLMFPYQFGSADMAKDLRTLLAKEKAA